MKTVGRRTCPANR